MNRYTTPGLQATKELMRYYESFGKSDKQKAYNELMAIKTILEARKHELELGKGKMAGKSSRHGSEPYTRNYGG